jgi:hypothetical protein
MTYLLTECSLPDHKKKILIKFEFESVTEIELNIDVIGLIYSVNCTDNIQHIKNINDPTIQIIAHYSPNTDSFIEIIYLPNIDLI